MNKAKEAPQISGIDEALYEFHKRFPGVIKARTNPFTNSRYASLDDIMEVVDPIFEELGLLTAYYVTQRQNGDELVTILTCRILHLATKEQYESSLPLPTNEGAQVIGGYMTYWRRYLLAGLLNITESLDDDGQIAQMTSKTIARLTEKQHSEILDFVEATGTKMGSADEEGTLLHHIAVTMNLDDIEQMSTRQASTILKMLRAKYKRQQAEKANG